MNELRRHLAYLVLVGVGLTSVSRADEPADSASGNALRVIDFPLHTDPTGVPLDAALNRLQIADPEFSNAGIDLGFLRFRGVEGGVAVFLLGDDDFESTALASGNGNLFVQALLKTGDVIALDRRGTGTSTDAAPCSHAVDYALNKPLEPGPYADELRRWEKQCAAFWTEERMYLDQFAIAFAVRDVQRVREALGVQRMVLIGYGTGAQIAWGAAAEAPDHVAAVVELSPSRRDLSSVRGVPKQIVVQTDTMPITLKVGSGDLQLAAENAEAVAAVMSGRWNDAGTALIDIRSRLARPNPAVLSFRATLPKTYDDFISEVARRVIGGRTTERPQISVPNLLVTDADVEDAGLIGRVSAFVAGLAPVQGKPTTPE